MNSRARTLVGVNLADLEDQHRFRNFVLEAEGALQHMRQISAQGTVLGRSLFPNSLSVFLRAAKDHGGAQNEEKGGPWRRWTDTSLDPPQDIVQWQNASLVPGPAYRTGPRSVVVLSSTMADRSKGFTPPVGSDLSPFAAEYGAKTACSTQNKAIRANKIVFPLLARDQEVDGSNPFAPTILEL